MQSKAENKQKKRCNRADASGYKEKYVV